MQPQPNYIQPPTNFNQPMPTQNYQQPPAYNPAQTNQQFVPPADFLAQSQNNDIAQQQNANLNGQPQNQPGNVDQRQQVNVSYYYGFPIGPQLRKNN